jgi:phosphatidylserine/phosphatidylglycerophosphate/cardiolipin synthase-like enzyme
MALDGDAAKALGELGRTRWSIACGERLPEPAAGEVPWPDELDVHCRDFEVAIARTCGKTEEVSEVREIEALFCDMIAAARRFVYLESQYFASRKVAEAITRRLAEPDPPEFVLVNPKSADGWLEEAVMGAARARLMDAVEKADRQGRFRIYTPVTAGGTDIYVHAKIMIVDDRMLRVGSANLNNRSMGLDSECDVLIDAGRQSSRDCARTIAELRCGLMAEHLGVEADRVAATLEETGSLIATVERLRGRGRTLVPFEAPEYTGVAEQVAESEIADPESADQEIEPLARRRLLRGLRRARR